MDRGGDGFSLRGLYKKKTKQRKEKKQQIYIKLSTLPLLNVTLIEKERFWITSKNRTRSRLAEKCASSNPIFLTSNSSFKNVFCYVSLSHNRRNGTPATKKMVDFTHLVAFPTPSYENSSSPLLGRSPFFWSLPLLLQTHWHRWAKATDLIAM